MKDGFIKTAAAAPELRVADPKYNAEKIVECIEKARGEGVKVLTFPELAITGATCGHLYYQRHLLDAALEGLRRIAEATRGDDMLVVVGLPLRANGAVYSAAAVLSNGEVLGLAARRNVRGTVFALSLIHISTPMRRRHGFATMYVSHKSVGVGVLDDPAARPRRAELLDVSESGTSWRGWNPARISYPNAGGVSPLPVRLRRR